MDIIIKLFALFETSIATNPAYSQAQDIPDFGLGNNAFNASISFLASVQSKGLQAVGCNFSPLQIAMPLPTPRR